MKNVRRGKAQASGVSMREIGRQLGVSAVTVSKALGGKPGVSDAVREQIIVKAEELGYKYELTTRSSKDVGILVPGHFFGQGNSFYASLCKKLVQELAEHNCYGVLSILSGEEERNCAYPTILGKNRVSGLVILGQVRHDYMRMLASAGTSIPYICMDFYDEKSSADAVVSDGLFGSYRLTSHLIHKGHKQIGFLGSIYATSSIMDRYLGYYKAMMQNNLAIRDNWIVPDRDEDGEYQAHPLPDPLPTAFVCNCDRTAMLFIKRLESMGLKVPRDVSLVGLDDYTETMSSTLTTFAVDQESLARESARLIIDKMHGKNLNVGRVVTGGHIVYRDSVKDLAAEEPLSSPAPSGAAL